MGTINQVGVDYVSVLVLGVFNASIPSNMIRSRFTYDESSMTWVDGDTQRNVFRLEDQLVFEVTKYVTRKGGQGARGLSERTKGGGGCRFAEGVREVV